VFKIHKKKLFNISKKKSHKLVFVTVENNFLSELHFYVVCDGSSFVCVIFVKLNVKLNG